MIAVFWSAVLALTGPAADSTPPPIAPPPALSSNTEVADNDHKIICKKEVVTGTRFATRICKTKTQWDDDTRDAQDYVNQRTTGCRNSAGC